MRTTGAAESKGPAEPEGTIKEVVFREIILGEVEALFKVLDQRKEIDQSMIDFLCGHILRYIATLRVQAGADHEHPSVIRARGLLDRLATMSEEKAGYVPPLEDETAVIRRFIEAEDIELLSMQFDSLVNQTMALQKEVDMLREGERAASAAAGDSIQSQELRADLELREQEIVGLKRLMKERLESVVRDRQEAWQEAELAPAGPGDCGHGDTLAKWKIQMKEFGVRYRALDASLRSTQDENSQKAKEIEEWRRRFAEFQATIKERVDKRAQELLRVEQVRSGDFKGRSDKLGKIEATNLVFPGTDGLYVFPKTIVRALDLKPGESLGFQVDASGARIVKTGRPR